MSGISSRIQKICFSSLTNWFDSFFPIGQPIVLSSIALAARKSIGKFFAYIFEVIYVQSHFLFVYEFVFLFYHFFVNWIFCKATKNFLLKRKIMNKFNTLIGVLLYSFFVQGLHQPFAMEAVQDLSPIQPEIAPYLSLIPWKLHLKHWSFVEFYFQTELVSRGWGGLQEAWWAAPYSRHNLFMMGFPNKPVHGRFNQPWWRPVSIALKEFVLPIILIIYFSRIPLCSESILTYVLCLKTLGELLPPSLLIFNWHVTLCKFKVYII